MPVQIGLECSHSHFGNAKCSSKICHLSCTKPIHVTAGSICLQEFDCWCLCECSMTEMPLLRTPWLIFISIQHSDDSSAPEADLHRNCREERGEHKDQQKFCGAGLDHALEILWGSLAESHCSLRRGGWVPREGLGPSGGSWAPAFRADAAGARAGWGPQLQGLGGHRESDPQPPERHDGLGVKKRKKLYSIAKKP